MEEPRTTGTGAGTAREGPKPRIQIGDNVWYGEMQDGMLVGRSAHCIGLAGNIPTLYIFRPLPGTNGQVIDPGFSATLELNRWCPRTGLSNND